MRGGNVLCFPASTTLSPRQALHSALAYDERLKLAEVIVVGFDDDGDFFVRSSRIDCKTALWLVEKLREYALNGGVL